ncbi:MAG: dUTP diphosphatase [Clostridia bacterium]|nr:dUTP diphosphatase [Clostridia bacterium]
MNMKFKKLDPAAVLPTYGSAGAAGADLYALPSMQPVTIRPGQTVFIHTGLSGAIPEGYAGLVFARSGLASKRGLAPANKVGVIDSDYRGEWMIALHNHGSLDQTVLPGDRIAQLVIVPVLTPAFEEVDELDDTNRGAGGFGSTGTN